MIDLEALRRWSEEGFASEDDFQYLDAQLPTIIAMLERSQNERPHSHHRDDAAYDRNCRGCIYGDGFMAGWLANARNRLVKHAPQEPTK